MTIWFVLSRTEPIYLFQFQIGKRNNVCFVAKQILRKYHYQLRDALSNEVLKGGKDVNVLRWMSRAALEYIGQAGLGHSFGPIREKSKYNEAVRMFV